MKTRTMLAGLLILSALAAHSQKYITKTGYIRFFSDAPLEKIEAHNRQVSSALDLANGGFVFNVLMKSFTFEKALMQEHFNENYVESDKFPNARFSGKVTNIKDIDPSRDGVYEAQVEGKLTLHGITKDVKVKGSFEAKKGRLTGKAVFPLTVSDYDIKIPGAVVRNIAKTVEITVEVSLDKANP